MAPIVLASASPRRHELLALGGLPFEVRPAALPEIPLPGEIPSDFVQRMSQAKARLGAEGAPAGAVVIGADTVVVLGDEMLGKPDDAAHAAELLKRLRGRTHLVLTGLTLIDTESQARLTDVVSARVPMRDYSDAEIDAYVASGDPLDKAGAYAIQYRGFQPVDLPRFGDCFANVMGLPVCRVLRLVRRMRPDLVAYDRPLGDCQHFDPAQCPFLTALRDG